MENNLAAIALGFFDGVHRGHQAVLQSVLQQKENGFIPCVFTFQMNEGELGAKAGIRTLQTVEEKEHTLKKLGIEVVHAPCFTEFKDMSPRQFIEEILIGQYGAGYIACGYDFHFGKGAAGTAEDLRRIALEHDVTVDIVSAVSYDGDFISSTRIRAAITEGDIPLANALLGRPFTLKSEIVHGKKLGRTISFPTINQRFDGGHIVPRLGVYATILNLQEGRKIGATNVGTNPTVSDNQNAVLAETYIVDFCSDIYGEIIEVEFYEFIRPEEKFSSIDALKEAIAENAQQAVVLCKKYL